MLKYVLLAGAMTLSVQAFAQDKPVQDMAPQTTQPSQPTTDQTAPATQPDQSTTAPTDSAAPVAPAAAAPAQDAVASAQPTPAAQVSDVVGKEFAGYDKNGDGTLSAKEFDAWMVALKTASDPATKATSPATKTWLTQAFAQADKDKNRKVSKAELTGFLSQG